MFQNQIVGAATAIGSFPHKNSIKSLELIEKYLPIIPIWPQLPKRDFKEDMNIQYSENLPFLCIDQENKKIYFDIPEDKEEILAEFYTKILENDIEYFKISPLYSEGFYSFLNWAKDKNLNWIKGHITGPITFGLVITDQTKRSIIYHDIMSDVIVKAFSMKAKWQITKLKDISNNIIIFIDEPYLSSVGSVLFSLQRGQVIKILNEIIDAIHEMKALSGIHCCGNTDWSIVMETNVDIINLDAYEYANSIIVYPNQLKNFLNRGGKIAWGIVPTSEKIEKETVDSLLKKLHNIFINLESQGINKNLLYKSCLITPSCGLGSRSEELAEKILKLNFEISNAITA